MSSTQIEDLRTECKFNLFFLGNTVLNYDQILVETHGPLCNYLETDRAIRKLVLMPRGHLKSTIATVTRSIQRALQDPERYRCLIANSIAGKAQAFLYEIKMHWERTALLRRLFPELIPPKLVGPGSDWSQEMASINRRSTLKESTWTCVGTGGSATAYHFNHIIPDDLIDEKHKESRADMERAIRWNRGLEALLDNPDTDEICWVGTRKTMEDVYADVMRIFGSELSVFVREPIENGAPIFPLKFSMQRFQRMMEQTPAEWAHDYMNNPVGEGGIDWGTHTLQFYRFSDDGRSVVFFDQVHGVTKEWRIGDLDIVITVDPNSGKKLAPDKAAVMVHGTSPDREILVLATQSGRPSPDELIGWIWDAAMRWNPRVIGIEEAGQQNTIFYFEKLCIERRRSFRVVPLKHNNKDKERRIRTALDTPIRTHRLYTHATQITLNSQLQFFPQLASHNWDELDCLSYGPELYVPGMRTEDIAKQKESVLKIVQSRGVTGYGRSWRRRSMN